MYFQFALRRKSCHSKHLYFSMIYLDLCWISIVFTKDSSV